MAPYLKLTFHFKETSFSLKVRQHLNIAFPALGIRGLFLAFLKLTQNKTNVGGSCHLLVSRRWKAAAHACLPAGLFPSVMALNKPLRGCNPVYRKSAVWQQSFFRGSKNMQQAIKSQRLVYVEVFVVLISWELNSSIASKLSQSCFKESCSY